MEKEKMRSPEKILGVMGGLGPAASAEFLRLLAVKSPARRDQEHPRIYMYSNPQMPDRSTAILGKGASPAEDLKKGLMTLTEWGADLLAVPCNTAHYFIDEFRSELSVPLVHIVEATVDAAKRRSPEGSWLLATSGTKYSRIYENYAEKIGYEVFSPDEDLQGDIQGSIDLVKANRAADGGRLIRGVVEGLWKKRNVPIIAACTELPLAYDASGLAPEGMVSSLSALADACLERLYQ